MHVAVDMTTVAVAIACTARSHTVRVEERLCKRKKLLPVTATISFQNPTKLNSYYARLGNTWKCIHSDKHTADDVTDADVIAQHDNNDRFMNTFKMRFFLALRLQKL